MRILWIHQYFATPEGWGCTRTYEFARRWAAAGHEVDVVCGDAYDASLVGCRGAVRAGIRVFASRVRYRPGMNFAARLWSFVRFLLYATAFCLRHGRRYDLVVATSTPLTVGVPALAARAWHGTPFIFDVGDVWPDAAVAAGVLRNPLLIACATRLEHACYRRAAHVTAFSPGMQQRIVAKGVPAAKVTVVPNCCDSQEFAPDAKERVRRRREMGVDDATLVVLYIGAMGPINAVDDLVETVRLCAGDARIVWWFAGDGREAWKLRQLAQTAALGSRVRFLGCVAKRDVPSLCRAADVGLVTAMHAPLFEECCCNKFFDCIAAGLPVLFNRSTWLEPLLARYGNGIVCRDDPPAGAMAAALGRLAGDPALCARMGAASRRMACEEFDRDRLALAFLRIAEQEARGAVRRRGGA